MAAAAAERRTALVFNLDGTLVDSVYQHVLDWHHALLETGIELSIWRIHRRIGMSGGLFARALLRETRRDLDDRLLRRLQELHAAAYKRIAGDVRHPCPAPWRSSVT
jgi:beta-phosphoglucomutase-like phosphatase (HAD superfamily)